MLPELDNSDWQEVFKYATPHTCEAGHDHGPTEVLFGSPANPDPFTREDVVRIVAMVEGERDGEHWVGAFELRDGRYASIRAWCDYTGWG